MCFLRNSCVHIHTLIQISSLLSSQLLKSVILYFLVKEQSYVIVPCHTFQIVVSLDTFQIVVSPDTCLFFSEKSVIVHNWSSG